MRTIVTLFALFAINFVFSQAMYENAMNSAMENWEKASTTEDFTAVANQFDRIAAKETDKWEPLYYAMLVKSVQGFNLPKDEALKQVERLELDYAKLTQLINNDETKVLEGIFKTVKLAKDPMTYGPTLPQEIMAIYTEALKINPNNPRAIANSAEFDMGAAEYFGQDPKIHCPKIEKAIELFKKEEKDGYKPTWGQSRAEKVLAEKCGE